ncbi:hypothetical protein D3C73_1533190 [compost metagenome]
MLFKIMPSEKSPAVVILTLLMVPIAPSWITRPSEPLFIELIFRVPAIVAVALSFTVNAGVLLL